MENKDNGNVIYFWEEMKGALLNNENKYYIF